MRGPWDATFEHVLLAELKGLDDGVVLEPDTPLAHYGLTSLGSLQLGEKLSHHYGIAMRSFDERAFRTARSLWTFISENDAARTADANSPTGQRRSTDAAVRSLAERFAESARRHADAVCLIDGDEVLTYAQMADQAAALASVMGAGGVIAVLGEREVPTYRAYLAALYAGATVVPLSMDFPPERNAEIVRQAGEAVYPGSPVIAALSGSGPLSLNRNAGTDESSSSDAAVSSETSFSRRFFLRRAINPALAVTR